MTSEENYIELTFSELTTDSELFCQFDEQNGVLLLDVKNNFTDEDFEIISNIIDPYFKEHGELRGIIINSKKFPYWKGAKNRAEYVNFAANNHHKFAKVAFGMSGFFIKVIMGIAKGRVHPEIKLFKYNQIEKAQDWILEDLLR
ncbi:MAG: hypothetical protein KGQ36_04405 [Rickettsiales bacterium]|nr:hypothetical protein [Rickettsiales bacterium]